MKICDLLNEKLVIPSLKNKEKQGIIEELINLFQGDERVLDLATVKNAVLEREKILSTGVGKGFAIPHAKSNGVKEIIVAFGKTSEPVNFDALDGKPVRLVFLLVAKEDMVAEHIRLLSRISRMMNKESFREALLEANTSEEILKIICEEEKSL